MVKKGIVLWYCVFTTVWSSGSSRISQPFVVKEAAGCEVIKYHFTGKGALSTQPAKIWKMYIASLALLG